MAQNSSTEMRTYEEKVLHPANGILVVVAGIAAILAAVLLMILFMPQPLVFVLAALVIIASGFAFAGIRVVRPNEALVLTLFGRYYGTVRTAGCHFINPLCVSASKKPISLKVNTLKNVKQKVNDAMGNPIFIGCNVVWRIADPTKAVFNVEDYAEFISIQSDSTIRNIARLYPYDLMEDNEDGERTLRSSSLAIAEDMRTELQRQVAQAGAVIEEVKITDLAYSEEIAAAMLQRQQAVAVIAARAKIVDGAVGMVKMALDRLSEDQIVLLDDDRKANMVSNLLVVLCSGKDSQPVLNTGTLY